MDMSSDPEHHPSPQPPPPKHRHTDTHTLHPPHSNLASPASPADGSLSWGNKDAVGGLLGVGGGSVGGYVTEGTGDVRVCVSVCMLGGLFVFRNA